MDIFINDFKDDVQNEILDYLGIKDPKELNLDVLPLFNLSEEDFSKNE